MNTTTSPASDPDLDWSHIKETVRMLNLAVAQIAGSMKDGDDSVNILTNSFTEMFGAVEIANAAAAELPDSELKETIKCNCMSISAHTQSAIVAFQFYDRLTQRLEHVTESLESLGNLVADPAKQFKPHEWSALQEKIRSKYTIKSEHTMFEAILKGTSIEDALKFSEAPTTPSDDDDDIELF